MTIKSISHIHICVANVEKSLKLCRDILELTVKTHTHGCWADQAESLLECTRD